VVGDEVEHQPQPAPPQPVAQSGQRRLAAHARVNHVRRDGEAGAGDVLFAQVRYRLLELAAPLAM
jgi:hypothetical protein